MFPLKYAKLAAAIQAEEGLSTVYITTSTEPRLTGGKKNPHIGRVRKITEGSKVLFFRNTDGSAYNNMVKRRLAKEGKDPETFKLSPRTWGSRIPNTPFIHHTDKEGNENYYLEAIFVHSGKTHFTLDGKVVDASEIQGLTYKPESHQGGLSENNKVIIRSFKLDSLLKVSISHNDVNNDITL
jgi:hypothetical protein